MRGWLLAAGIGGALLVVIGARKSSGADIEALTAEGYASGIREPGELAVYVASSIWPEESWPPSFSDSVEKDRRYADVWVSVTSYLGSVDGRVG